MGIEGQESPRDVASEDKRHPWEVFPADEPSAEKGRKERNEDKNKKEKKGFFGWVKANKLLSVGIVLALVAIIVGAVIGFNALKKNGVFGGEEKKEDETAGENIGIPYEDYLNLLSLEKSSPENAWDYAIGTLKPILDEGAYNSGTGFDYTKAEDNFEVFIKKVEKPEEKICYRLAMIYTFYRTDERSSDRADNLLELFDEENNELNRTQRYFYLMVQTEKVAKTEGLEAAIKILDQIDEEYPVDEGYVDIETGEEITDQSVIDQINEGYKKSREGEE